MANGVAIAFEHTFGSGGISGSDVPRIGQRRTQYSQKWKSTLKAYVGFATLEHLGRPHWLGMGVFWENLGNRNEEADF
jgi:hypothetical protein